MKGLCSFLVLILIVAGSVDAQIMIAKPGDTVMQKSAMLEVKSNERGFLPPRMSTTERRAIGNPVGGLMVFDTTKQALFVFTKSGWQKLSMEYDSINMPKDGPILLGNLSNGDFAGHYVKLKDDLALVGAYGTDVNGKSDQGVVHVLKLMDTGWVRKQVLTSGDGMAGDFFGSTMAIADSFVFVSANGDDIGENNDQGSVYVYKRKADTLTFFQKLSGLSTTSGDRFGTGIAAESTSLIIGASFDDVGANSNQGSVYFFGLENGLWVEKSKYFSTNGANSNDFFGSNISIDSNLVVVGNIHSNQSGSYGYNLNSVIIFKKESGVWSVHSTIPNPTGFNGEAFGSATSILDSIITIGATNRIGNLGSKDRGVVYVYKWNGATWGLIQTLAPPDANLNDIYGDYFGTSSAQSGKLLLVGSHYEDTGAGQTDFGGVYVYSWNGSQFVQKELKKSSQPALYENFGYSVAIDGNKILIGAMGNNNNKGAAYFYTLPYFE